MYAIHPIPLSEVKAIRKHTPSFGWQYIVVVLVNGLTLPPLYFGTGGVRALFAALKQVCAVPFCRVQLSAECNHCHALSTTCTQCICCHSKD